MKKIRKILSITLGIIGVTASTMGFLNIKNIENKANPSEVVVPLAKNNVEQTAKPLENFTPVNLNYKNEIPIKLNEVISRKIKLFDFNISEVSTGRIREVIGVYFDISFSPERVIPKDFSGNLLFKDYAKINSLKISQESLQELTYKNLWNYADVKQFIDRYSLEYTSARLKFNKNGSFIEMIPELISAPLLLMSSYQNHNEIIGVSTVKVGEVAKNYSLEGKEVSALDNKVNISFIDPYLNNFKVNNDFSLNNSLSPNPKYFPKFNFTTPVTITDTTDYSTKGIKGPCVNWTDCIDFNPNWNTGYTITGYEVFRKVYTISRLSTLEYKLNITPGNNTDLLSEYREIPDLSYDNALEISESRTFKTLTTQETGFGANQDYLNSIVSLSALSQTLDRINNALDFSPIQRRNLRDLALSGKVLNYDSDNDIIYYNFIDEKNYEHITTIRKDGYKPFKTFSVYDQEYTRENTLQYYLSRPYLLDNVSAIQFKHNWNWIEQIKQYPDLLKRTWSMNDARKYFSRLNIVKNAPAELDLPKGVPFEMGYLRGKSTDRIEYNNDLASELIGKPSAKINNDFADAGNLSAELADKKITINQIKSNNTPLNVQYNKKTYNGSEIAFASDKIVINKDLDLNEVIRTKKINSNILNTFKTHRTSDIKSKFLDLIKTFYEFPKDDKLASVESLKHFQKFNLIKNVDVDYSALTDTMTAKVEYNIPDAIQEVVTYSWTMGDRNAEVKLNSNRINSKSEFLIQYKDETLSNPTIETNLSKEEFDRTYEVKEESNHIVLTSKVNKINLPSEIRILKNYKSTGPIETIDSIVGNPSTSSQNSYMWIVWVILGAIVTLISSIVLTRTVRKKKLHKSYLKKIEEVEKK